MGSEEWHEGVLCHKGNHLFHEHLLSIQKVLVRLNLVRHGFCDWKASGLVEETELCSQCRGSDSTGQTENRLVVKGGHRKAVWAGGTEFSR